MQPHNLANGASGARIALYSCAGFACLATLLCGLHMAELNAPSEHIKQSLGLSNAQFGWVTAAFSLGALLGSSLASGVANSLGLRRGLMLALSCGCVGSFAEARCFSLFSLALGRTISGVSGGMAIVLVPVYINAISPSHLTGLLGSMTQVSVNAGILFAQLVAIYAQDQWRLVLHSGWVIGAVGLALSYFYLRESPRWLLEQSQREKAISILMVLRDCDRETALWEIDQWNVSTHGDGEARNIGYYTYLTHPKYLKSRVVATSAMLGQQFSGINAVIFYGVSILNSVFPNYSILINCLISVGNMVITSISSLFLDRLGRKPLLLFSLLGMTVSCLGLTLGLAMNGQLVTIISIFSYVGSFAIGCGPIPFLLISEISQNEIKPTAQAWATNCNWVSVFIIGVMFPILNQAIGPSVYLIFATVALAFAAFVYYYVPETMGKSTYGEVWNVHDDENEQ